MWLQGWRKKDIPMLKDIIERLGLHSARIYSKGLKVKVLYKDKTVDFTVNPTNRWGELELVTNAELFEYYKDEMKRLKI